MTEEGGGGDLGTLEVGVIGDSSGVDAILDKVESRLNELVNRDWKVNISGHEAAGTGTPATAPTGGGNRRPARDPVADRAAREAKAQATKDARDAAMAHAEDLRVRRQTRTRNKTGDRTYIEPLKEPRKYVFKDTPAAPSPTPASAQQDVKTEKTVKFNTDVRKQVEADLAEPFELKFTLEEINLSINKEFLREQVVSAFSDLVIDVKANAQVGGVVGTPASASQGGGTPVAREWSAGVREMLKKNAGVEDAIHGLYTQLKAHAPESAPFTRDDGDKDALGKLDEIAQRFGVTSSRLVETIGADQQEKTGKARLAEGPLGTTALKAQGFDAAGAKAVAMQATVVQKLASASSLMSDFVEESRQQPQREAPRQEAPRPVKGEPVPGYTLHHRQMQEAEPELGLAAMYQTEIHDAVGKKVGSANFFAQGGGLEPFVQVDEEHRRKGLASWMYADAEQRTGLSVVPGGQQSPEAKAFWAARNAQEAQRPITETPTAEARAPRAVFRAAEDFVDHIRAMAGDINPANIPNTQDVLIPAALAKEGELPREALQAAKMAAGRSEGTQGGLGDISKILALASRATGSDPSGAFRDYAYKLDKPGGKRTGEIIKYDPGYEKEDHPFYDRLTGKQRDRAFFGTTPVEKANPAELLQTALKAIFPGIEVQKTPGDPMSSLLGRVMAGPAPASLAAQPSIPGDRGAGGYAPGSAKSLRESQVEFAKNVADIRDEIIGQMFDMGVAPNQVDHAKVDQLVNREVQRRTTTAAEIDKQVTGPQSRRRNARSVAEQAKLRREEGEAIRAKIASGALPGELDATGTRIKTAGYVDLMAKIAESDLPLRNTINKKGGFDKGAINTALQPVDEAMYDRLGLTGGSRNPKALDKGEHYYVGAERSSLVNTIYERNRQAEQDLDRRPDGIGGRRPAQVVGQRVTGKQTSQGEIEQVPEYARPPTANDRRLQEAQAKLGRDATEVRQKEMVAAADEALRRTQRRFGATRKPSTAEGEGVDVLRFSSSAERGEAGKFYDRSRSALERPIKARQSEEIASTVSQIQHFHAVKLAADRFLKSIAAVGTTLEDVTVKNVDGEDVVQKRRVGEPDVEKQRALAQSRPLINLPEGVTEAEVKAELKDVLDYRAAGVARTPKTKAARNPLSGDQGREIMEKAGGLVRPSTRGEPPFAGYNRDLQMGGGGRGVGVNDRGRFQPGGAPIEVIVVGRFPLPVELVGPGSARAGEARGGAVGDVRGEGMGKRRKNIVDQRTIEVAPPPPPTDADKKAIEHLKSVTRDRFPGGTGLNFNKTPREVAGPLAAQRAKEEAAAEKLQYKLDYVDAPNPALERQRAAEERRMSTIVPVNKSQVALEKQRAAEERADKAKERQRQTAMRSAGRGRDLDNIDVEEEYKDLAENELSPLRAQLRTAERRVPKRGFTASVTDLITAAVGGKGFEGQLESLGRAQNEMQNLRELRTRRARTLAKGDALAIEESGLRARPVTEERDARLSAIGEESQMLVKRLQQFDRGIATSTRVFEKNIGQATSVKQTARSFGAAGVGALFAGGAGALTVGLGMALAPAISAAVEGITSTLGSAADRLTGYTGTASRVQQEMGTATLAAGGRGEIAFAQSRIQSGLGPRAAALIAEPITQRGELEAGNQALRMQLDQFRASQKFSQQGRFGESPLNTNMTGFMGFAVGGTPSAEETISDMFEEVVGAEKGASALTPEDAATKRARLEELASSGSTRALDLREMRNIRRELNAFGSSLGSGSSALDFFNAQAEDAAANIRVTPGSDVSETDRAAQVSMLVGANFDKFAKQVKDGQIAFTDEKGQTLTNPQKLIDALTVYASNAPKPSPDALLDAQKDSIKAQIQTAEAMSKLTLDTLLPASRGIASAGEGDIKLGDRLDLGATAENKAEAAAANERAKANRQAAINFVRLGTAEIATKDDSGVYRGASFSDTGAGLGEEKAEMFATALNKAAGYSNQINDIQLGVQVKQAALAADQYSYSIGIAKRSLQDAKALIGDIAGGTNNLGAIERQNFLLQRQSQTLGLELSQRQINFQRAIANFQAPGLSSEEREARKQAAKIEADYAQKQLDIQKKLFGLAGQSFDVQGRRSVDDQIGNIGLMERGRKIVIDTADAEKKIANLSKKRDKELATVQSIYQTAVDQTQYIIGLSGQLVAATGKDMGELANDVIQAYAKVYKGLIANANESLAGLPYQGGSAGYGGVRRSALGSVGMVNGATAFGTNGVMGEAGGEAYAILRDPQKLNFNPYEGGGASQTSIVINVTGNTVRNDGDLDEIARKVERVMNTRGAQLGLRPLGG